VRNTRISFVLLVTGLVAVARAGPPPVIHLGQVFDAHTKAPLPGVQVRSVYDGWPADATKRWVLDTETDSLGVYGVTLNRPGEIHFVKAGYDSVILHWPDEFSGVEQGGCDISLGPVWLHPIRE
jgi:hypothetical protein